MAKALVEVENLEARSLAVPLCQIAKELSLRGKRPLRSVESVSIGQWMRIEVDGLMVLIDVANERLPRGDGG